MKNVFLAFVVLFGLSSASAIAGSCSTVNCGSGVVRSGTRTVVTAPVRVFRGLRSRVASRVQTRRMRRYGRRYVRSTAYSTSSCACDPCDCDPCNCNGQVSNACQGCN